MDVHICEKEKEVLYTGCCSCFFKKGAGPTATYQMQLLPHESIPLVRYLTAKLALNYLIDRLEKLGSTRASRADSLQVKQWGVVCHMSMLCLSARDL